MKPTVSSYLMRKYPNWNTKSSCQPEISKFKCICTLIYEQILWFQISVKNSTRMTVSNPTEHLIKERLQKQTQEKETPIIIFNYFEHCKKGIQDIFSNENA